MYKKEFFGVLLLVSLVSTILLAGMVNSTVGPSISVYPSTGITASSDVYVYVTGTGWTPGSPVTLYWDQQTVNHTIAVMAPSTSGTFRLNQLEIESVPIGTHTIIAVQGGSKATCTYTVTATLPPDETLLDSIQQVENSMGNTQSNFTTVIANIATIEGKLDNATSGLPGIQTNLTKIDTDANNHPGFYSNQGSWYNGNMGYGQYPVIEAGHDFNSSEFTITVYALSNVSAVDIMIYTEISVPAVAYLLDVAPINQPLFMGDFEGSISYTCAAQWVLVTINPVNPSVGANVNVQWSITAETPPGVGITWVPF